MRGDAKGAYGHDRRSVNTANVGTTQHVLLRIAERHEVTKERVVGTSVTRRRLLWRLLRHQIAHVELGPELLENASIVEGIKLFAGVGAGSFEQGLSG